MGALGTALKTWRDVALLKQDSISKDTMGEIRERLVRIEEKVSYIDEKLGELCQNHGRSGG